MASAKSRSTTKKPEPQSWRARLRVTYDVEVTVTASTVEEATLLFKSGDWDSKRQDGVVDWGDPINVTENS